MIVAYGRKSEAIEQSADADRSKDRQSNGAEDWLKIDQKKRRMADRHLCHREIIQQIFNIRAEKVQSPQQNKLNKRNKTDGQRRVLEVKARVGRQHKPFILKIRAHKRKQQNAVENMVTDLKPHADLYLIPKPKPQKRHKHRNQNKNPYPARNERKDLNLFGLAEHRGEYFAQKNISFPK